MLLGILMTVSLLVLAEYEEGKNKGYVPNILVLSNCAVTGLNVDGAMDGAAVSCHFGHGRKGRISLIILQGRVENCPRKGTVAQCVERIRDVFTFRTIPCKIHIFGAGRGRRAVTNCLRFLTC